MTFGNVLLTMLIHLASLKMFAYLKGDKDDESPLRPILIPQNALWCNIGAQFSTALRGAADNLSFLAAGISSIFLCWIRFFFHQIFASFLIRELWSDCDPIKFDRVPWTWISKMIRLFSAQELEIFDWLRKINYLTRWHDMSRVLNNRSFD